MEMYGQLIYEILESCCGDEPSWLSHKLSAGDDKEQSVAYFRGEFTDSVFRDCAGQMDPEGYLEKRVWMLYAITSDRFPHHGLCTPVYTLIGEYWNLRLGSMCDEEF